MELESFPHQESSHLGGIASMIKILKPARCLLYCPKLAVHPEEALLAHFNDL